MNTLKHDLAFGLGLSAILFVGAVAWGGPFLQTTPDVPSAQLWRPGQAVPVDSASIFTGTIVKYGDQYCLRDAAGQIYSLDDPHSASAFDGHDVKVTGQLVQESMLIRVEQIRNARS